MSDYKGYCVRCAGVVSMIRKPLPVLRFEQRYICKRCYNRTLRERVYL